MTTVLSESNPIAQKSHRCTWCGETINKGDKYYKYVHVFDLELCVAKMHTECEKAFYDWCHESYNDDGYGEGQFKRGTTELK